MTRTPSTAEGQDQDGRGAMAPFVRRVIVALLLIGLALLARELSGVLLLVFGAVLIAVIIRAIADPLIRWARLPQPLAVIVALLILVGIAAAGGWLLGAQVAGQIDGLKAQLPEAWRSFENRLGDSSLGQKVLTSLRQGAPQPGDVAGRLGSFLSGSADALSNFIIVLFAGVFLALKPGEYRQGVAKLFPKDRSDQVSRAFDNCGRALRLWLLGQLFSMVVVGVLTGIGLQLAGVPSALALGFIAGLAEFIPMLGPVIAAAPGLLLALPQGIDTALWALAVYVGVQQIESNLLTPVVEKHAVSLPPVLTLLGVLALGVLFGPLGIVLAAPLVVTAYVLVKQVYVRDALGHETTIPGEKS